MKFFILSIALAATLTCFFPTMLAAGSLTEFDGKSDGGLVWRVVDDGVMGGVSKGNVGMTESGTMKFSGLLSLENNGGFSSVRTNLVSLDLSGACGLKLRVKGDGRTYQVRLSTDAKFRGMEVSFMAEFPTTKGKWTEVSVPFSDMMGTWRGRTLPDVKFDPSNVQRLGLLLADKQAGEFGLEIDYLRTYGEREE
jgi:NADH dehydrogenase [ubiquinone] 1 alpha subcomplex assembly factor 1